MRGYGIEPIEESHNYLHLIGKPFSMRGRGVVKPETGPRSSAKTVQREVERLLVCGRGGACEINLAMLLAVVQSTQWFPRE